MHDILSDEWYISGNSVQEMYIALKELSKRTHVITMRTDDIQIFTYQKMSDMLYGYINNAAGTNIYCIPYRMLGLPEIRINEIPVTSSDFLALLEHKVQTGELDGNEKELYEEIDRMKILFVLGEEHFLSTKKVLKTLCQRAGSAMGDFALRDEIKVRFHRDGGYVAYMAAVPSDCSVVYREAHGRKKVYAVLGSRYKEIPQYPVIQKLLDAFESEMGQADVLKYHIDNFNTEIFVEFPQKANEFARIYSLPDRIVPGVRIQMSDVGDSSFIINGTIKHGPSTVFVPGAEYSRAHTKKADIDEILSEVSNRVFPEYTKVPERLLELITIKVADYEKAIQGAAKFCGIEKAIGKKHFMQMVDELCASCSGSQQYTAYDIAVKFIDVADDLLEGRSDPKTISMIRSACIKTLDYKFQEGVLC